MSSNDDFAREMYERIGRSGGWLYLSEVEPEEIEWLWPGRIPAGKITVLDGDPGLGKSAFTTDLAARVSVGRGFPDGSLCEAGGVVLLNAEDGIADTIRPRLDAARGDATKVIALSEVPDEANPERQRTVSLPHDLGMLEAAIEAVEARLVIIDPLMAFLTSETNSHKDQDIRRVLASLKSMADRKGAAILLVRHLNKGGGGGNPLYAGGGSIGIIGAARAGLIISADPEDDQRRILATSKQNLAQFSNSLLFAIVPAFEGPGEGAAKVEYLGESFMTARDAVKPALNDEEKTEKEEAIEFIRKMTEATDKIEASEMFKEAKKAGIAEATLKRAKASLGIKSFKEGDQWYWPAPGRGSADPLDPLPRSPYIKGSMQGDQGDQTNPLEGAGEEDQGEDF